MINIDQPPCQKASNTRQNCPGCEKSHNACDKRYTNMVDGFHNIALLEIIVLPRKIFLFSEVFLRHPFHSLFYLRGDRGLG